MHVLIRHLLTIALLLATHSALAESCLVPGGTPSEPTDLARYVSKTKCNEFILQDGFYKFPNLTRAGITIRAEHAGKALVANAFSIDAQAVTIDGIAKDGERNAIAVRAPGATIRNCTFSNFGKTGYGKAVWIWDESLNASQITVVTNNTFDNWGGAPASACVIIGTTQDKPHTMDEISVHVLNNRFTHGPTAAQKPTGGNSAIQAFDPFLAVGNYIDTVNGPAIQNKTKNSRIIGNTIVNCTGWGSLYNRAAGNNQWLSNVVMHADFGFDVFHGDHILFQGNVFYDVKYFGNIKNFRDGTHDLIFRNNTFCKSSGWAAIIWDKNSTGTFSRIVFQDNVFFGTKGRAIAWQGDYDKSMWDEMGNVYWESRRPVQPTTGSTGSSVEADPKFANVPKDFTITSPTLAAKGAKWPISGAPAVKAEKPADAASAPPSQQSTLADALALIRSKTFVDLTHAFEPGIPHWPGFPDEKRETLYWYEAGKGTMGNGFYAQQFTHVGQWGTHCDPPAHFVKGKRTIDQITPKEMILPLVVIDVHQQALKNADYTLTIEDVRNWERRHGAIPQGAFVAMRTDWSKRWPDAKSMRNADAKGVAHYPGWSMQVLKYLYEQRKITASGHETTDTDPGVATSKDDYSLETYILGTDHYQIELLANLDKVPEAGAIIVVTFPKPKAGSGFPARVFAILP